jgi:pSer/pThr/pTyr-binding forkhead associated (FHA) protein
MGAASLHITGRLVIQGANVSLAIPPGKQEVLIGREDPVSGVFPDINLDPYGGQEAGVSRRHARIILQGGITMLEDLNTVNGTVHNRQRLAPGQAIGLNDGDELRLGKMALIYQAN